MVKVIEKPTGDSLNAVCDAGKELTEELVRIMQRRGIDRNLASNIVAVAAAGVTLGANMTSIEMGLAIDESRDMWLIDRSGEKVKLVFSPPHRRPDYAEPERDRSTEN